MDLHLNLQRWENHRPDWVAGAAAGFAAGAVLMVLELLWAASFGEAGPWRTSNLIAAMVLGPDLAQSSVHSLGAVGVALVIHYLLGAFFGIVLAVVIAGIHRESNLFSIETLGIVFGAGLYLLNFHGMTQAFPWIAELRGWATFIAHLTFGLAAALLYWRLRHQSLRG
jgi:hypothetical protein